MNPRQKKYWMIACLLAAAALLLSAIGYGIYSIWQRATSNSISLVADDRIDITPQQIHSVRAIGEWEFLSVTDEVMVDTVRTGIFFDDQLVRIYYGTLRLGIDMQQLADDAISHSGDTLCIALPPVKLLDQHFIDEARTRSFISTGTWSNADREALFLRARQKMLSQSLTAHNIRRAEDNAVEQVTNLLHSMGFQLVKVKRGEKRVESED